MIFRNALAQAILAGRKSQTRRIARKGELLSRNGHGHPAVVVPGPNGSRIRYQVGNVYAVQNGRGLKAIGRIRLMSISSEHLQEISPIEAAMEGVEPDYMPSPWGLQPAYLPPFRRLWDRIHPKRPERWEDDPLVWALTFKLEGENDARHET
ncbi:MAG TPA: hypothetical protein VJK02_21225 [Anaerolineales bacterium]|nr:hypothetical protein [Anaerolineales bacterium]